MRDAASRRKKAEAGRNEPPMPLRDSDLRRAVTEDDLRPGDPSWTALVELQERRERDAG